MKKVGKKILTVALSALLSLQICAVGSSAKAEGLFIDNPVSANGKISIKVANYTDTPQKVRLYRAACENGVLNEVSVSEEVTVAPNGGAELQADELNSENCVNFIWSDALTPYDKDLVELPAPTNLTAPARDSASDHRTLAYNSFILEWDTDTTGVVDHYEVYEDGTQIGETDQGYYIVYSDDINEESKSYSIKAVTAGGKKSAISASKETGTLYMNEIDFSNMTVAQEETSFDVTYPYINTPDSNDGTYNIWTKEAAKYGTTEDIKDKAAQWVDETTAGYTGINSTGMKVHVGKWEADRYIAPARIAADETKGREARSAFKTYYSYNYSRNSSKNDPRTYDGGYWNNMYFALDNNLLTENGEVQDNVTFAWDYFDNGTDKLIGRYNKQGTSSTEYVGTDTTKTNTETWKTSQKSVTTYSINAPYSVVDTGDAQFRLLISSSTVPTESSSKQYISGVRAWLTDRGSDKPLAEAERRQMAKGIFAGVSEIDTDGITPVYFSGESQRRSTSDIATNPVAGSCQTIGKGNNRVGFGVADTYLGAYDNNVTIEFDYYNNGNSSNTFDLELVYNGTGNTTKTVTQTVNYGNGTVRFSLKDAGFANGLENKCDFTLSPGANTDNLYIKNMRVYASNNVR